MPNKDIDRREEILRGEYFRYYRPSFPSDERTSEVVGQALCIKEETSAIKNAMDEYMKEVCLELIDYFGNNGISHVYRENGVNYFQFKGQCVTKEQLFENFL